MKYTSDEKNIRLFSNEGRRQIDRTIEEQYKEYRIWKASLLHIDMNST